MTSKRMGRSAGSSSRPKGSSSSSRVKSEKHHMSSSLQSSAGQGHSSSSMSQKPSEYSYLHSSPRGAAGASNTTTVSGDRLTGGSYGSMAGSGSRRNRLTIRHSKNDSYYSNSKSATSHHHDKKIKDRPDVNLLAQGMSGRFLGARLSKIKPLDSEALEKDL